MSRYWAIPPEHSARFVAKMEDVLEVYARPYDPKRPVICMDEKPMQFLGESRPKFRCSDASMVVDCEYVRNGTCSVFMFVEPLTGWMRPETLRRRTMIDWAHQMKKLIDEDYPDADKIVLVMTTSILTPRHRFTRHSGLRRPAVCHRSLGSITPPSMAAGWT